MRTSCMFKSIVKLVRDILAVHHACTAAKHASSGLNQMLVTMKPPSDVVFLGRNVLPHQL